MKYKILGLNNLILRQQVMTLARIYPFTSAAFMNQFEDATSRPYDYLVVDLKLSTSEQDMLQTNIFESTSQPALDEENVSDGVNASSVVSLHYIADFTGLPYFSGILSGLKSHGLVSHDYISQST